MSTNSRIGIVGWGAYLPRARVSAEDLQRTVEGERHSEDVARVAKRKCLALGVSQFALPGVSEDSTTMGIEASQRALESACLPVERLGCLFLGSETRGDYKVRPTSAIIAGYLNAPRLIGVKDIEAACAAGAIALDDCLDKVAVGKCEFGLAVASDIAIHAPGLLEITQGAGAAAILVGRGPSVVAVPIASASASVHVDDFFRRDGQEHPFLNPGCSKRIYLGLCNEVVTHLLAKLSMKLSGFQKFVFHVPYPRMALRLAKEVLGLSDADIQDKVQPYILAPSIGNAYAASSLIGLIAALECSQPNDNILMCTYGSGAVAIAHAFRVVEDVRHIVSRAPSSHDLISRGRLCSVRDYQSWRQFYLRCRREGGSVISSYCRVNPEGETRRRISLCNRCGRVQSMAYGGICSYDDCHGIVGEMHLPVIGRVREVATFSERSSNPLSLGWTPIDVGDLLENSVGSRVVLSTRVLEIEGHNGAIRYGPAYTI